MNQRPDLPGSANDERLFDALRALPAPQPSTAEHRHRRRRLDDAIAADAVARRRRLSPVGIAAVAVVVLATTGAAAMIGLGLTTPAATTTTTQTTATAPAIATMVTPMPTTTTTTTTPAPTTAPVDVAQSATATPPVLAKPVTRPPATTATTAMTASEGLDSEVAALIDGDARRATTALMRGLGEDFDDVDARLASVLDRDDLGDDAASRVRRLRCEAGLRYRRDVSAVEVCRDFSRHHPDDQAARPLAFGAGGLAEELQRFDDAIDLYTRCIIVAPLHGQSSADALKARARVHAAAGHVDDAAADLRLFLRLRPAAGFDDDVRALAREVGLR